MAFAQSRDGNNPIRFEARFAYEKWTAATTPLAVRPMYSEKMKKELIKLGNSEELLRSIESERLKFLQKETNEKWERGTVVVRRYGDVVNVKLIREACKFGSDEWQTFKKLDSDMDKLLGQVKGVAYQKRSGMPNIKSDFSDGRLSSSVGKYQAGSRKDVADIDRADGYAFPMTIGPGIQAIFLADVSLDRFIRKGVNGRSKVTQEVVRSGHLSTEHFWLSGDNRRLTAYEYGGEDRVFMRIECDNPVRRFDSVYLPSQVTKTHFNGEGDTKREAVIFRFVSAIQGKQVPINDMRSLGPQGIEAIDARLPSGKQVQYKIGMDTKTDEEVRQLAAGVDPSASSSKKKSLHYGLLGLGGLFTTLGAAWLIRCHRVK
jgi:hypothetical protein